MPATSRSRYIRWFDELTLADLPLVGGKNASLGELYRELTPKGIKVPPGFALTVEAYRRHLEENALVASLRDLIGGLDRGNLEDLKQRAAQARDMIHHAPLPKDVERELFAAYTRLSEGAGGLVDVAVRSSATAEDLPNASFAGQQDTFLNVHGKAALLETCRRCFASLFTDRAIAYRADMGFTDQQIGLSIGVQRMVRSDLATAGVLFTLDTETGSRDVVLISAAYGLGETVVQGIVSPDEYYVFKPTLLKGKRPIFHHKLGSKEIKAIYGSGGKAVKTVSVPLADRERFALDDDDILTLARWGCLIEEHYSAKRRTPTPMDIEWAKDGRTGELFIVQARPETVQSRRDQSFLEVHTVDAAARRSAPVLATGRAVGDRVGTGIARVVHDLSGIARLRPGDVLVTGKTDPDWEPFMKHAAAIVTDHGSRTCHAAIVSRELGIPALVGTERGTALVRDGDKVTVTCAEGETGYVLQGAVPFRREMVPVASLATSFTNVMMNVGNPDEAMRLGALPSDGVGLARMEFIVANMIKIHPLALVHFDELEDRHAKARIAALTFGHPDKTSFFVDKLAEGIATIAAAFSPRDVILRFSDFKTNEYANLLGGSAFEPKEENPMLGFRGASRYYDEKYRAGFALECAAVKKVRETMGLTNLKLMVPFCRTPEEGRKVLAEMQRNGLERGRDGLEVYCMCEIPSNVLLADEFLEVFDGFSIGSNDLTQLTLGVDRDSETVAPLFDERNRAVTLLIEQAVEAARRKGKKIGICGQAPSDYPEFVTFLVKLGIDSISVNPDVLVKVRRLVAEMEETAGDR
jgi:pyruvate,water dikinase